MAQGTAAVLGRIALRRVPACAVPPAGREPLRSPGAGAPRPAPPPDDLDRESSSLEAVLAYLAAG